jgi:hypothetical protein
VISARKIALVITGSMLAISLGVAPQAASGASDPSHYYDLSKAPKPTISGKEILNGLTDFVSKFPLRQQYMPNNDAAAQFLAAEAKHYGFKVRTLHYSVGTPPHDTKVIEATKKGTVDPNNYIAFIAHYDIVPGIGGATIQGAYDDGTGTNILRYFAKQFSTIKTRHSIAIIWFDGEEWGTLGSSAYAAAMKKQGMQFDAVMGFDMTGIAYPAPYCLCIWHGPSVDDAAKAVPLIDYVNYDYLHFPKSDGNPGNAEKYPLGTKSGVCNCGNNIRNSDEASFAANGYFTIRYSGMRTAADYPGYHFPWDTIQLMEQVAGSQANLEKGIQNTFDSAYYTAIALDHM